LAGWARRAAGANRLLVSGVLVESVMSIGAVFSPLPAQAAVMPAASERWVANVPCPGATPERVP